MTARIFGKGQADIIGTGIKYKRQSYNVHIGLIKQRGKWIVDPMWVLVYSVRSGKRTDAFNEGAVAAIAHLEQTNPLVFQEAVLCRLALDIAGHDRRIQTSSNNIAVTRREFRKALVKFKSAGGNARKYEKVLVQ